MSISYVNNSASTFNHTPDLIIYPKDLGLPNDAVTAIIQRDQQLGVAANATPTITPESGVGIVYNGVAVNAGFDFGIAVNFFTFVPTRNFCDPHPRK